MMKIQQISVFLENRKGQLAEITHLLAENGVDLRAISIAETTDYGLARMIVDDSAKASSILLEQGNILSLNPVWVIRVPDRPAGLSELLMQLADNDVDIEYMYSLFAHKGEYAYMVIQTSNEEALNKALDGSDFKVIGMEELGLK